MIRLFAIAALALALSGGAALAQDAIVLRTSAPDVPPNLVVASGQVLDVPPGATVTLLFRDGRIATLVGDAGGRVRVRESRARRAGSGGEPLAALVTRPEERVVLGATRGPEIEAALASMRIGVFPQGDYVDQLQRGCTTVTCQALEILVDEQTPLSLYMRARRDRSDGFEVVVNKDAIIRCWRFDPRLGVAQIEPFDRDAPTLRNTIIASGDALFDARQRPAERFVGCAAAAFDPSDTYFDAVMHAGVWGGLKSFLAAPSPGDPGAAVAATPH